MNRTKAAVGSAAFLLVAPGTVAGVLPWSITRWKVPRGADWWPEAAVAGVPLITVGAAVLVSEFARFVVEGLGTPAPVAPTHRLVVGGLYRRVRNPMYLAVITTLVGQTLLFASQSLLLYTLAVTAAMVAFARWYEEPVLVARYGEQYRAYRDAVPGWIPRLRGRKSEDRQ